MKCRGIAAACALIMAFCVSRAEAQSESSCAGDARDDAHDGARLAQIEQGFAREQARARWWWGSWLAYASIEGAIGGVAYAQSHDRLNRDLWLVTWVGSAAFVAELAIFPMVSAFAPRRLGRLPRGTARERCAALVQAEHLLDRAADLEREGTSLWSHLLGAAWAFGTAGYLVGRNYDFDAPLASSHNRRVALETAVEFVWTVAVTELAIWTQPTDAVRNRAALPRRLCAACRSSKTPRPGPELAIGGGVGHASLRIRF